MAEEAVPSAYFSRTNVAAAWWLAGCSVVPIRPDGQKRPYMAWSGLQRRRAAADDVRMWFQGFYHDPGVAVICGKVSDNLEMLEFEGRAYSQENLDAINAACTEFGISEVWHRLLTNGYSESTPSGGLHLLYRITDHEVPANERIASRPATLEEYTDQERYLAERNPSWVPLRVLSETRGEGGYVIVAPSSGRCHPSGKPWVTISGTPEQILSLSWDQRCLIHQAIRAALHIPTSHDLVPVTDERPAQVERDPSAPLSPVEDFNERASWHDEWFIGQGWTLHHQGADGEIFWCRPGKDPSEQHAASTGVRIGGQDCLYVWSTSTSLPTETPLTKFMVFAHYRFNDDRSAAARWLQRNGYGPALHPPAPEFRDFSLEADGGEVVVQGEGGELAEREPKDYELDVIRRDLSGGKVLTDTGYALRMRDQYGAVLRFNTTTNSWYQWNSGVGKWEEDKYSYVEDAAKRIADQTYEWMRSFADMNAGNEGLEKPIKSLVGRAQGGLNQNRITSVVQRFRGTEGVSVAGNDFDATPDLLNVRNGTLSLTSFEMREHSPHDMLTCQFNANYDPSADCPNFRKYLDDVFPDVQVQEYIQRALGYSLCGRPGERALFLLHGPSGTGKSVFIEVMSNLFGDYGVTSPSTTFKQKKQESTFDLHQLRGKRFVAASELPEGMQLDEELIKRITGGDRIPSRALYQGYIEWVPQCVIWLATNFLPRLSGDDDAIWRRVRTIPMRTIIRAGSMEIKGFGGILSQEGNGILNWLLEGLREYRRVGLNEPTAVLSDVETYRTDTDTVASWLHYATMEGAYVLDPDGTLHLSMAYGHYDSYCIDNGVTKYGKQRFQKKLTSLHGIRVETKGGQRIIMGLAQAKRGL